MAAKKGGLGKGLDSLITDKVNKPGAAKDTSLTPTEDQALSPSLLWRTRFQAELRPDQSSVPLCL